MSWPVDGGPRFVTASISGPTIHPDGSGRAKRRYLDEAYVYDRACSFAIVRRFGARGLWTPLERAERCAEALNRAQLGERLTRAQAGHLAGFSR